MNNLSYTIRVDSDDSFYVSRGCTWAEVLEVIEGTDHSKVRLLEIKLEPSPEDPYK